MYFDIFYKGLGYITNYCSYGMGNINSYITYYNIQGNQWGTPYNCGNLLSVLSNQNSEPEISIFPNPANGTITINSNEIIKSYELINNLGQIIINEDNINSKTTNISSDKLLSGIYFIKIYCNNNRIFVNKLFINK